MKLTNKEFIEMQEQCLLKNKFRGDTGDSFITYYGGIQQTTPKLL